MTVEEIFEKLASHMIEGLTFHRDMMRAHNFLGLYGFGKCHEYHYFAETKGYMNLICYYSTHYHKLINTSNIEIQEVIPETWYRYTTMAVDANTKRTSTQELMKKWATWEHETKKLYCDMYKELYEIGEIAAANEVNCYICDVDEELKHTEKKIIKLETLNYDIGEIIKWQQPMYKKFKKALQCLFK